MLSEPVALGVGELGATAQAVLGLLALLVLVPAVQWLLEVVGEL